MGGFGNVDRGGSREGKKSLRKVKIAIVEAEKSLKKAPAVVRPTVSPAAPVIRELPPPSAYAGAPPQLACVDGFATLLSRQLESDFEAVKRRAREAGVAAILVGSSDFERMEEITELCAQNAGEVYMVAGIHPDMIKRTTDKVLQQRQAQLKQFGLNDHTVCLASGLDLARDISTHHVQEKLLEFHVQLAHEIKLPLMLHVHSAGNSAERTHEILTATLAGFAEPRPAIAVFHHTLRLADLAMLVRDVDAYVFLTGAICQAPVATAQGGASSLSASAPSASSSATRSGRTEGDEISQAEGNASEEGTLEISSPSVVDEILKLVPRERLLLASVAPHHTPQNIQDVFIRMSRNEPSNLVSVLLELSRVTGTSAEEWSHVLYTNALRFFQLRDKPDPNADAAASAEDPASGKVKKTSNSKPSEKANSSKSKQDVDDNDDDEEEEEDDDETDEEEEEGEDENEDDDDDDDDDDDEDQEGADDEAYENLSSQKRVEQESQKQGIKGQKQQQPQLQSRQQQKSDAAKMAVQDKIESNERAGGKREKASDQSKSDAKQPQSADGRSSGSKRDANLKENGKKGSNAEESAPSSLSSSSSSAKDPAGKSRKKGRRRGDSSEEEEKKEEQQDKKKESKKGEKIKTKEAEANDGGRGKKNKGRDDANEDGDGADAPSGAQRKQKGILKEAQAQAKPPKKKGRHGKDDNDSGDEQDEDDGRKSGAGDEDGKEKQRKGAKGAKEDRLRTGDKAGKGGKSGKGLVDESDEQVVSSSAKSRKQGKLQEAAKERSHKDKKSSSRVESPVPGSSKRGSHEDDNDNEDGDDQGDNDDDDDKDNADHGQEDDGCDIEDADGVVRLNMDSLRSAAISRANAAVEAIASSVPARALDPSEVRYACRKCRKEIFTGAQLFPHGSGFARPASAAPTASSTATAAGDLVKKESAGSKEAGNTQDGKHGRHDEDKSSGVANARSGENENRNHDDDDEDGSYMLLGAQANLEEDDCQATLYLREAKWGERDEGRIVCPHCDGKIGRWGGLGLRCKCGELVSVHQRIFRVARNKLDVLLPDWVTEALRHGIWSGTNPEELGFGGQVSGKDWQSRKAAALTEQQALEARALAKKKKASQRATRANFSQFRNKDFSRPRGVQKAAAGAGGDSDDNDEEEDDDEQ